jgi:hypothetical protein
MKGRADKREEYQAKGKGFVQGGKAGVDAELAALRTKRGEEDAKKTKEAAEKASMSEKSVSELHTLATAPKADKYERAAAAQELAKKGALDMSSTAGKEIVKRISEDFGETSTVFKQMNNKIRQYDPVAAFENITNNADGSAVTPAQRDERMREYLNTNEFDVKKVGVNSFKNEGFVKALLEEGAVSMKDLEDVAKKSDDYKNNLKSSLTTIATAADAGGGVAWDHTNTTYGKKHKAIQEAHFNFNGNLSSAVDSNRAWKEDMFSKLSKDFGTNMDSTTQMNNDALIAQSVNPGKYKDWIQNMKDKTASRDMNRYVVDTVNHVSPAAEALKKTAKRDSFLQDYK